MHVCIMKDIIEIALINDTHEINKIHLYFK